jgi:hypothetical protein
MTTKLAFILLTVLLWGTGAYTPEIGWIRPALAQAPPSPPPGERTAWYFYTVRWGAQDEFLDLFQKNHYPVLRAQLKDRITRIRSYVPTYHGDGRADWTFAVALTFRDTAAMTAPSPEPEIAKKLFPDQELFREEEQRRFELLDAHWDVPLSEIDFETRIPVGR